MRGTFRVAFELTLAQSQQQQRLDQIAIYLFTFCPPGPDDLLKLSSPMFLGIVSASSLSSHSLAAWSSSSFAPEAPRTARPRTKPRKGGRAVAQDV